MDLLFLNKIIPVDDIFPHSLKKKKKKKKGKQVWAKMAPFFLDTIYMHNFAICIYVPVLDVKLTTQT